MNHQPTLEDIRAAHERGLGVGDVREIELVGEDVSAVDWGLTSGDTFASRGQHTLYHGLFKPIERLFTHTPLVVLAYLASWAYHDWYWYPLVGSRRVNTYLQSRWGELFTDYGQPGKYPLGTPAARGAPASRD